MQSGDGHLVCSGESQLRIYGLTSASGYTGTVGPEEDLENLRHDFTTSFPHFYMLVDTIYKSDTTILMVPENFDSQTIPDHNSGSMAESSRMNNTVWLEKPSLPDSEDASTHMATLRVPPHRVGDSEGQRRDPAESSSDVDDSEDPEALGRTKSTRSIAETLPWYRELLFVAVICLGQLFTRKSGFLCILVVTSRALTFWMPRSRGGTGPSLVNHSYYRLNLGP